jgi:superfamily II DNA or RNA helicase
MILFDGIDYISTSGSVNFTASGLARNSENLVVAAPWNSEVEKKRINSDLEEFSMVFNEMHPDYSIIDSSEMIVNIKAISEEKELDDLITDGRKLLNQIYELEQISTKTMQVSAEPLLLYNPTNNPQLPPGFILKDYQEEAYLNWLSNNCVGLFAMATGTGKTITAINCAIQEFKKTGSYRIIICVPGIPLIHQWKSELKKFNFKTLIDSSESNWKSTLEQKLLNIKLGSKDNNFVAILTYESLKSREYKKFKKIYLNELASILFIGDEVHNLGSPQLIQDLPIEFIKKIGLSATPDRKYDDEGTSLLYKFFNVSSDKFTAEYNMYNAIRNGVLSEFNYHPIFVTLEEDESAAYLKMTKKLSKFIDFKTGAYRVDNNYVKMLLIQRKAIVQKARNKIPALSNIIDTIGTPQFRRAFIYVSPGYDYQNNEIAGDDKYEVSIIDAYTKMLGSKGLKVRQYTSKSTRREEIIQDFSEDKYHALVAMQCLDEGVDIKQTKYAIFCSSTGNPRQFIQRRGRVLRKFEDKVAEIYDLIVVPNILNSDHLNSDIIQVEKNIFRNELNRIIDFIALSKNFMNLIEGDFGQKCKSIGINNLEELIYNEIKRYEKSDSTNH